MRSSSSWISRSARIIQLAGVARGMSTPMRCKIVSYRFNGKASRCFDTATCASNPGNASLLGIGYAGGRGLDTLTAVTGMFLADMAYLDRCRHNVQLLGDRLADLGQSPALMLTAMLAPGSSWMTSIRSRCPGNALRLHSCAGGAATTTASTLEVRCSCRYSFPI